MTANTVHKPRGRRKTNPRLGILVMALIVLAGLVVLMLRLQQFCPPFCAVHNLTGQDFHGKNLRASRFANAELSGANF